MLETGESQFRTNLSAWCGETSVHGLNLDLLPSFRTQAEYDLSERKAKWREARRSAYEWGAESSWSHGPIPLADY